MKVRKSDIKLNYYKIKNLTTKWKKRREQIIEKDFEEGNGKKKLTLEEIAYGVVYVERWVILWSIPWSPKTNKQEFI